MALYPGAPPQYRSGVSQLPNPLTGLYRDKEHCLGTTGQAQESLETLP
jgi:hypothetical protein